MISKIDCEMLEGSGIFNFSLGYLSARYKIKEESFEDNDKYSIKSLN